MNKFKLSKVKVFVVVGYICNEGNGEEWERSEMAWTELWIH